MARTRRGSGEGSIFQRGDGIWTATLNLGYDEKGKRRRRTVYGKTKAEVREKLVKLHSDSQNGLLVDPSRKTVSEFLAAWLEGVARPAIRPSTYVRYERIVRLYINPYLGGVVLNKLTPPQVQSAYATMERDGLSPSKRESAHTILRMALDQALKWGLVARNVCTAVQKPRVKKKAFQVLSPEAAHRFLQAAEEDRLYALYVLAITTGLRQGEMLALRWQDLDLKAGTLSVRHTLVDLNGKLELGEPKTAKGKRRVMLPAMAAKALKDHRKAMLAEGNLGEWVFCDTEGGLIRKSNFVRRSFKPLLKKAKVPEVRFHDLRHTAATMLLSEGVHPKVVQEILGHSQISVTLDTYSHVLPSMQVEAASKVDNLFARLG